MKILVPLDGSALAEHAVEVAEPLARALGAEVVLFTVAEPAETSRHAEEIRTDMETELSEVAARLPGITVHRRIDTGGRPAEGIMAAIEELGIDHVVMTTHGRSGLSRLAHGSVAEQVIRDARVPITLVRPSEDEARRTQAAATRSRA